MKDEIQYILDAPKSLSIAPNWAREEGNEYLNIVSPLDVDGITLEGWRFRAKAHIPSPDMDVTFQIEALFPQMKSKFLPIVRFNWLPRSPHSNHGRGPSEWRYSSMAGSHIHPYYLNWQDGLPLKDNLPIALPVSEILPNFQSALVFVEDAFRIYGVGKLPVPPWEAKKLL